MWCKDGLETNYRHSTSVLHLEWVEQGKRGQSAGALPTGGSVDLVTTRAMAVPQEPFDDCQLVMILCRLTCAHGVLNGMGRQAIIICLINEYYLN